MNSSYTCGYGFFMWIFLETHKVSFRNSVLSLVRIQQRYIWRHISDVAIIARFVGFIESSSFKLNGKEMTTLLCKF